MKFHIVRPQHDEILGSMGFSGVQPTSSILLAFRGQKVWLRGTTFAKFLRVMRFIDTYRYASSILYVVAIFIISTIAACGFGYQPLVALHLQAAASASPAPGPTRTDPEALNLPLAPVVMPAPPPAPPIPNPDTTLWPIHGKITTAFGASDLPYQAHHTGIDISSGKPAGVTQVVAFKAGTVFAHGSGFEGYGNLVAIAHGSGLTSYYGHLARILVSPGQKVSAGDVIGVEGSTGNSTGPHVHFEVRLNNVPVNPRNYLAGNP